MVIYEIMISFPYTYDFTFQIKSANFSQPNIGNLHEKFSINLLPVK